MKIAYKLIISIVRAPLYKLLLKLSSLFLWFINSLGLSVAYLFNCLFNYSHLMFKSILILLFFFVFIKLNGNLLKEPVISYNSLLDNLFIFIFFIFIGNFIFISLLVVQLKHTVVQLKHTVFKFISKFKLTTINFTICLYFFIFILFNWFSVFYFYEMPFFFASYLKFLSIFILILINLYLIMSKNKEKINRLSYMQYMQSGLKIKNLEKLALAIGYVLGNMSSIISIKNEIKEQKINSLNKQIDSKLMELKTSNAHLEAIRQEIENEFLRLAAIQSKNNQYSEYLWILNELNIDLTNNLTNFHNLSSSDQAEPSELLAICETLKVNIGKFSRTQSYFEVLLEKAIGTQSSDPSLIVSRSAETENKININVNTDPYKIEVIDDIHKSSIINFESSLTWFEGLRGLQKLAFCILLGKGILISAISSIVFIFYGDRLIAKYDLTNKYPKLSKFIESRRKYKKYSLMFNFLLIFIVVLTEILVGLSILSISFTI